MITNKHAEESINTFLNSKEVNTDIFILLGSLSKNLIVSSIQIIESKLKKLNYPKTLISKAKLVSIELLDNILNHQSEIPKETPYFELSINKDMMRFSSGNCINNEDYQFLDEKLNRYEKLTTTEIQKEYIDRLKTGTLDKHGNAGLGILTILKRSNKKFTYGFKKISSNQHYFSNTIKINNI